MVIKDKILLKLDNYEDERTLHIYKPDYVNENDKLSVLYMFDGHNLFFDEDATYGNSWKLKDFFDEHKTKLLIVGIECNHFGNERLKEFTPYSFKDPTYGQIDQKGKTFFKWMINTLKPYIDTKYNTYSDVRHTFIGGSSMGGLMALYGAIKYSNIYSKALCLSPYVYHVMDDLCKDIIDAKLEASTDIYISYGSKECRHNDLITYTEDLMTIQRLILNRAKVYLHLYKNQYHSEVAWRKETKVWYKELHFDIFK